MVLWLEIHTVGLQTNYLQYFKLVITCCGYVLQTKFCMVTLLRVIMHYYYIMPSSHGYKLKQFSFLSIHFYRKLQWLGFKVLACYNCWIFPCHLYFINEYILFLVSVQYYYDDYTFPFFLSMIAIPTLHATTWSVWIESR